ncbi:MAG: ferritin-like domain-containing protein [Solirubrobacterales bacterium]|nr:ferritin-like domain-containing protein [Solirubrobacterales bacterium]
MTDSALRELEGDPSSRKRFFKMMGGAGAVSAFGVFLAACGDDDDDKKADTAAPEGGAAKDAPADDLAIVNYALTLEYLEADFYQQVIDSGLVKDKAVVEIAKKFGETEQEHVDALKATAEKLGGPAAEKPTTKFDEVLAGGLEMVLSTAATVENLGAAAYLGQAGNIKDKEILAAALAIHTVEARHAAALNQLIGAGFQGDGPLEGSVPDGAFAKPMDMQAVLEAVKPFIAS